MRTCALCGESKLIEEFHKGQYACKPCNRARAKEHYEANREHRRQGVRDRLRIISEFIDSQKLGRPCVDCGVSFPPICMDFDHLGDKEFGISRARNKGMSIERIKAEIAKCELVCANCHRIRTFSRNAECLSRTV